MSHRILLVSPASPFEPRSGAQQRSALLYEALKTLGEVDVLLIEPSQGPSRLETPKPGLLGHGLWHAYPLGLGKFHPDAGLHRALLSAGIALDNYRLIVSRYLNPIAKLRIPVGVHTVVDLDDWGYHYAPQGSSLGARLKSGYAAWLARQQLDRFDAFFCVSRRDQNALPGMPSTVLPNIPFNPPSQPFPATPGTTLLFVGSLWYAPNREGIDHFLAHAWPDIKAARPDTRLLLVGAAPAQVRQRWASHAGVSAPGYVEDLDAVYRDAAFCIAPIRSGGGTNIKIIESLAYGRACVTTPHCADAFEEELGGAGLAVAADDARFAAHCLNWLDDPARCASEAARGHHAMREHFSRSHFVEQVRQRCAALL